MPAGDEVTQGFPYALILTTKGRTAESMEELFAAFTGKKPTKDSSENVIGEGGGPGPFDEIELPAGQAELVLETPDDSGKEAVHGPERDLGECAHDPA